MGQLNHYCTRCGNSVVPYPSSRRGVNDDPPGPWDYAWAPQADLELPEGVVVYSCVACQSNWIAYCELDTGMLRECGHFLPIYVSYCGQCGE